MAKHEEPLLKENSEYPGGITWVDREYDPRFVELPPDENFRRLKAIGRWFKQHVLASVVSVVIATFITTILVFYTTQWLTQHQATSQPQSSLTKETKTTSP